MKTSMSDERYMHRCLQLAENGMGCVRPNPMVGCVVVKDERIVAEGYHVEYGGYHAERNALLPLMADESGRALLRGATLYVNLEPCSHWGKTPPCSDLVVESGVRRVVCCNDDPNPLVAGRGFAKLREAGIELMRGVLEKEGRWLNRRFFTFIEQQRPYIILKWAKSRDGFMAPARTLLVSDLSGEQSPITDHRSPTIDHHYWLSTPQQTLLSHKWRTEEAAILVGSQTYIDDHPQLTARLYAGSQPQAVVLDRRGRLRDVPARWIHARCSTLQELMQELWERRLQSVIVEGGRRVLDAFIAEGLCDEVRIVHTPAVLGAGLKAPDAPNDRPVLRYY